MITSLAVFDAPVATIEARFGPPVARDCDSNGIGLFDAYGVRFPCGLEVELWRFHHPPTFSGLATEACQVEVCASDRDLDHIAFHLDVPVEQMKQFGIDRDGVPSASRPPKAFVVMRTDDNGQDVEVTRVTSRCEAAAIVRAYEARAHKQTYWIAERRSGSVAAT